MSDKYPQKIEPLSIAPWYDCSIVSGEILNIVRLLMCVCMCARDVVLQRALLMNIENGVADDTIPLGQCRVRARYTVVPSAMVESCIHSSNTNRNFLSHNDRK